MSRGDSRLLRELPVGIRARILFFYVALLALAGLISIFVVRQVLLVRLDDRVESDLTQEVEEFERLAQRGIDPETGRPFGADVTELFQTYLERNVPGAGEELITVPREGRVRFRRTERASAELPDRRALLERWRNLEQVERGELDTPAGEASYVAVPVRLEGATRGTFVVAIFTAEERAEIDEAVAIVAAVSGGVLILSTLLAFFAVGRVLAPLRALRDAARSVSGADMSRRLDASGRDELAELGQTFNRMLDRLEFAFSSQRGFIRDASHELRTPITIIRGHLDLLSDPDALHERERDEALALISDELDRMSRFVDDLSVLARAERPDFLRLETVDLGELAKDLLSKARGMAERRWRQDATSSRIVIADRQRLTQAAMNLVQNAIAHTQEGDEIALGCAVEGTEARVWVRDSGPGVPPAEQEEIFDRFRRGRRSRSRYEGSGLGLSIVRAIAEAHGGRVELRSDPGEGASFAIVIPVDLEERIVEMPAVRAPR